MISHIKNKFLRRLTIIAVYAPWMVISAAVGAAWGAQQFVIDLHGAAVRAWRKE